MITVRAIVVTGLLALAGALSAPAQGAPAAPSASGAAAAAGPTAAPVRAVTLDEALTLARANALGLVQARGQQRTGSANVRSSLAAFLPSLTLNAGSTRQFTGGAGTRIENGTVITLPNTPWSYSAGLGANLLLFDGGSRFYNLRQARAGEVAADANEVAQRYAVDLAVKQRYFDVLAARESEAAASAQVDQAEAQARTAALKLRAATATKSDSLRSEIQLRNAHLAVVQARTDLETANAALAHLLGVEENVTATELDSLPTPRLTLSDEELVKLAREGPAVRQAIAQLASARAAKALTLADYLPSMSLGYNRSGNGSGTDAMFGSSDLSYSGTLRLTLSMPLFDQLGRENRAIQRDVATDNAEAALRDAQLGARENLTRSLGALRTAAERVEAQTASVAAAEEDLRVQQLRYGHGESTLLDVLTSQTTLNDARAQLIRARYDMRVSRAQIEALIGRDL